MRTGCRDSTSHRGGTSRRGIGDERVTVQHRAAHGAEQHAGLQPPRIRRQTGDLRQSPRRRSDQQTRARQRVHNHPEGGTHRRTGRGSANIVTVVPVGARSPAAGQVW
jgi:hypothetical protein